MLVYEAIGETLKRLGVDAFFGLMGDGNMRFITHAAEKLGIAYYGAHHENGATAMADGYARAGNRVGVCSVTQGPGVTNALSALTEAVKARTPLLFLAGENPARAPVHNQQLDQAAVFNAVGAGIQRVRAAATIAPDLARAFNRALAEQRPVAVSIPNDFNAQSCPDESLEEVALRPVPRAQPDDESVRTLCRMIAQAERPLIIAGRGAVRSEARAALEMLGERIGALFATTLQAKGFFSGQRFDAGISGGFASAAGARLIGQADLVLAFGTSLPVFATRNRELFSPSVKIAQIDSRPEALGALTRVDYGLTGDAAAAAAAIAREFERMGVRRPGFRAASFQKDVDALRVEQPFEDRGDASTIDPRTLMSRLDSLLPVERTVVVDSGHAMGWSVLHLKVPDARSFIFGNDFMVVGLGVATAMGAAVARPGRLTVAAPGDGGLGMSVGELETLVRYRMPMLVLAMNDAAFGVEVHILRHLKQSPAHAQFSDVDFAAVARGFGAQAITVRKPADLDGLKPWLAAPRGPMLADCKLNPNVIADWFMGNITPGSWLLRMLAH
jgi:thiamine pyrophosphate-dependent acetolactate synthase large subunit-like protein